MPADQLSQHMTLDQARAAVAQIRANLHTARALLLDLYRREGWRALGYESWRSCVVTEFPAGQSQLYRELAAAEVELNVSPAGAVGWLPETHARALASLPPELQALVHEQARALGVDTAEGLTRLVAMVAGGVPPELLAAAVRAQEEGAKRQGAGCQERPTNWPRRLTNAERLRLLREQWPELVEQYGAERFDVLADALHELAELAKKLRGGR